MDTNNITDVEVEDVHGWDYPDFADAYISSARWKCSGCRLTEEELDDLNDNHGDFVYEQAQNYYF